MRADQEAVRRAYDTNDERQEVDVAPIPWPLVGHVHATQVAREALSVIDLRGSRDDYYKSVVREARTALQNLERLQWARVWEGQRD